MALNSLPIVEILLGGKVRNALVDTGCSTTLVRGCLVTEHTGESYMNAFDGRAVECHGFSNVQLVVDGMAISVTAVVVEALVAGVDVVLGMDVIEQLGGVTVRKCKAQFGGGTCMVANKVSTAEESTLPGKLIRIDDKDFCAKFDGREWTVEYFWKDNTVPTLRNRIACYNKRLDGKKREDFDREVERWIAEGILVPWGEEVSSGILPLMAVEQPTKHKIRPVFDFRELNGSVSCHTGDEVTDVCGDVLREWRQMDGRTALLDLKSAYLQIRVSKKLWKYQLVNYKNKTYCLTRLGFGLNSAPRIMSMILKTVLKQSQTVGEATSSYIDDIMVNETCVSVAEVAKHLRKHGLETKPPEQLDGGAALGLKLNNDNKGDLVFSRANEVPDLPDRLTRRELFSVCGKLVGHYPIAGWARISSSFVKRNAEGTKWDDYVGDHTMTMMKEVVDKVRLEDPVAGKWTVPKTTRGVLWCDASSIGIGVILEINNTKVEDAAWLRKKNDYNHINVAELEAVLKGVNLAIKWRLTEISIMTDSATVYGWVRLLLSEARRIRTKGAAEIIVKRRLGILGELIEEFNLNVTINLVTTDKNKADVLTRVRKSWLSMVDKPGDKGTEICAGAFNVQEDHAMHHMGVDRSLFLARMVDPTVTRQTVQRVVRSCAKCQAIDPAPVHCEGGHIGVNDNWKRLAIDVTHYKQELYLSIVDCGPGRFALWRKLKRETAEEIAAVLHEVFLERGPVAELLMDNATVFRSVKLEQMLARWNVGRFFRAAYRPSGNGIVERNHRTIKTLAERGDLDPVEAVFWYNMSPRAGQDEHSIPHRAVSRYEWRHPMVHPIQESNRDAVTVEIGEEVWVKPPDARCTSHWKKGVVTGINSNNNVSVDGMPRHVLDIRSVVQQVEDTDEGEEVQNTENDEPEEVVEARYPQRVRGPPPWMNDYVT